MRIFSHILSFVTLCAIGVLPSCNGIPNPEPTPEPTPTATPWKCPLEVPGCHETDPPQTCSTEESPCSHNPTNNPEHCEYASDCDPGPPQPTPPPGTGGCVEESNLVAIDCPTPGADFQDEVKEATNILGDLRGRPPQENLQKLAEQLREQMPNRCLIGGIEAVFIQRDDGSYEENHAVFFGNGAWTNSGRGVFVGCHEDSDPTEPPGGECVDPDPTGLEARFKGKKHHQDVDTVYQVKSFDYCTEAGFTNRTWCPLRNEGDPDREVCEEQEIGEQQWWCDGEKLDPCVEGVNEDACVKENRAQARCHGHSKFCTEDGRTCGEFDW
ncbi:MAG: hypothetical protein GY906_24835 [bacterium]|nr:hypothetical protein [bacterium]